MKVRCKVIENEILVLNEEEQELNRISLRQDRDFIEDALLEYEEVADSFEII